MTVHVGMAVVSVMSEGMGKTVKLVKAGDKVNTVNVTKLTHTPFVGRWHTRKKHPGKKPIGLDRRHSSIHPSSKLNLVATLQTVFTRSTIAVFPSK